MRDLPSTEALTAFLTTAELGSMSSAATMLGVTHAAVSRRVRAIEHWLGCRVFERGGRGVRLTDDGAHFARRVVRALASIETLGSEIRAGRRSETLRISVLPAFARLWLLPRLARLQTRTRGQLIEVVTDHQISRVEARESDLAIRFGAGGWTGAQTRLLFEDTMTPAASPEVAERLRGQPASALIAEPLIHDSDGADWPLWFRTQGLAYRSEGAARRYVDYDLALQTAREGLGVALLRLPLAQAYLADGGVVPIGLPTTPVGRGYHLVLRLGETRASVLKLADEIAALA